MIQPRRYLIILLCSIFFFSLESEECSSKITKKKMEEGFNASFKPIKNNFEFYGQFTFLYFQPKEAGLEIALIKPHSSASKASILNTHFNYSPGFRIIFGSYFTKQAWDMWLSYTGLKTDNHAKKKSSTANTSLVNYWTFSSLDNLSEISSTWKLNLKIYDVDFGRSYLVGNKLIFHPFFGIKTGKIDQGMEVSSNSSTANSKTSFISDSFLFGTKIGLKTSWILEKHISFFGNGAASIFFQDFKVKASEEQNSSHIYRSNNFYAYNPNAELEFGFNWENFFNKNKILLTINFGYELDLYWNQNAMRNLLEEIKNYTSSQRDNLMPHGFIFSLKLDF